MSEEKKIYCTQCGNQNDPSSKFCCNCGAKLERPDFGGGEEAPKQEGGLFSGDENGSYFEKITDAEEEKPAPIPEIQINYGSSGQSYDSNGAGSGGYYDSRQPGYYSQEPYAEKKGGGNIGFAIPLWYVASFPCYAAALAFSALCWPLPQLYLALSPCASNTTGRGWRLPELQPAA